MTCVFDVRLPIKHECTVCGPEPPVLIAQAINTIRPLLARLRCPLSGPQSSGGQSHHRRREMKNLGSPEIALKALLRPAQSTSHDQLVELILQHPNIVAIQGQVHACGLDCLEQKNEIM